MVLEVKSDVKRKFIGSNVDTEIADALSLYALLSGEKKVRIIEEAIDAHIAEVVECAEDKPVIDELMDQVAQLALDQWEGKKKSYKNDLEKYIMDVLDKLASVNIEPDTFNELCRKIKRKLI